MTTNNSAKGGYDVSDEIVDFILGITYEIWEEGGIDLCHQYYAHDCKVYGLDGITNGSEAVVQGTRAMLSAFPDRLLLGDDVITSGDCHYGYSSHRVLSPAINHGDSMFGAATNRPVRFMNMADCLIEEGIITLEWLTRDNLAVVRQLGFDELASARIVAESRDEELSGWFETEAARVSGIRVDADIQEFDIEKIDEFASAVISANWTTGNQAVIDAAYAPYAVVHRSPIDIISGRESITSHYAAQRIAFDVAGASVDHICVQPWGSDGHRVAVRWAVAGTHRGTYEGIAASGKPVYILGVSHWRIVNGRIASEWTVFDRLAVMSQLI